jgi:putative addiction module killer protein
MLIQKSDLYFDWFKSLRDQQAKSRILSRLDRVEAGNLGECESVGEGVSEMKIHYGPGYRIYFIQRGTELIVLLGGGDKSTQAKDIKNAIKLAKDYRS